MTLEIKIMLFILISALSVLPSVVSFMEHKKASISQSGGSSRKSKILLALGILFIPTHILFASMSLLAQTNDGFTIMSLTWFSIVLFILCELALYFSVGFYFYNRNSNKNLRTEYMVLGVINAVLGIGYVLYHFFICYSIDLITMLVFMAPFCACSATLILKSISYKKTVKKKKTNNASRKV